jgi:hypothetical protein
MDIIKHISNSFFGIISDLYTFDPNINSKDDKLIYILMKENRYLYLSLLLIFIIIAANLIYNPQS